MTKKKFFSGLPEELESAVESITKEQQRIRVWIDKRSYGKLVTVIEGIEDGKEVVKKLKEILGCGGTYKEGRIELRGNHTDKIKKVLIELGYSEENIDVEGLSKV